MSVAAPTNPDPAQHPGPADAEHGEQTAPRAAIPICRGVRGAITIAENTPEAILEATREMLEKIIALNGIEQDDVASVIFTTTPDVTAEYPAVAARQLGWHDAALMCGHEMNVPKGLRLCIRVLIHWNTTRSLTEIQHVYLRGAVSLRPDRSISDRFTR